MHPIGGTAHHSAMQTPLSIESFTKYWLTSGGSTEIQRSISGNTSYHLSLTGCCDLLKNLCHSNKLGNTQCLVHLASAVTECEEYPVPI